VNPGQPHRTPASRSSAEPCLMSEHNCKAADCKTHGTLFPR
jgi:hypothetical protein